MVRLMALTLCLMLLAGCGAKEPVPDTGEYEDPIPSGELMILEDEAVALAESPAAMATILEPVAAGKLEKRNPKAVIDYSNTADGYVMVQYMVQTEKRLKVQVKGPTTTYTYNLTAGQWEVFPLSDGNGAYQIAVFENVTGNSYALAQSVNCNVTLTDEFAPYLRPNQYVNYSASSKTVEKARELLTDVTDPLEQVKTVYEYVVKNLTYDKQKAANVKSGYLPVLDRVLEEKKGICFDYAAVMTAMLRSQGIPCKLVVGYAGSAYHAWISVWTEESGWVNGAIFFDGQTWQRMDPTFASSGKESASIMKYIGDGANYTEKYLY